VMACLSCQFESGDPAHTRIRWLAGLMIRRYTVVMPLSFQWDPAKAALNVQKHGVSFEEAKSVFYDDHALFLSDPDHSDEEERFLLLGFSLELRLLVVCHCYRESTRVIRIISARQAIRREKQVYAKRRKDAEEL